MGIDIEIPSIVCKNKSSGRLSKTSVLGSMNRERPEGTTMSGMTGLYALDARACEMVYGPEEQRDIAELVSMLSPPLTKVSALENRELLGQASVIFSGWGGPVLDEAFLEAAPRLKAVFYAAGSVSPVITDSAWERGVLVSSAYAANAVPVAEYTLATILFSLKHGWRLARQTREQKRFPGRDGAPGAYGSTVGLVSLGMIGRTVLKLLKPFDLKVLAYDPFLTGCEAERLGVERVSLDELFSRSDAVSVHTPWLPETEDMIGGEHLGKMKQGASFINTARGQIVRERDLIEVAMRRPDLQFVLDVTAKEPPDAQSPLYTLANVVLTPHIAGSVGKECRRLGRYMVEELGRFVRGEAMKWVVTRDMAEWSCHRPIARIHAMKRGTPRVSV
jgi:phosphoglycerate dehydrogenase-like enzyme